MSTADLTLARIADADPLVGSPDDVAGSAWGLALLEAVVATDPGAAGGPAVRPAARPALRVAIATALLIALLAGGAYAAYRVLTVSHAAERGVGSLTLPGPEAGALLPDEATLRPLLATAAAGTQWDLSSVRTRDRGPMFVLGVASGTSRESVTVGRCPVLTAGAVASLCLSSGDGRTTALAGRVAGAAGVRVVTDDGARTDGEVGAGAFLAVAGPGAPERIEVLDADGAVIASLPAGPPDGGG